MISLAPPLGMKLARAVVEVLVLCDSIIEAAIVKSHWDVVINVEGLACSIPWVNPLAPGQLQAPGIGLVSWIQDRIVDGIKANHAFVNVGSGVVHAVVVEPEERLLLVGI